MTVPSLSDTSRAQHTTLASTHETRALGGSSGVDRHDATTGKIAEAAKDFEAVLLRQMLSALERTTKVSCQGSSMAGQQTYGALVVETVADAIASAGGIGMADLIAGALAPRAGLTTARVSAGSGAADPNQRIDPVAAARSSPGAEGPQNSPQGLSPHAVPKAEIRATSSRLEGSWSIGGSDEDQHV